MKIEYDQQADAIYVYLTTHPATVSKSREIEPGVVVDLNAQNHVIGLEVLDASRRFTPEELFEFSVKRIDNLAQPHAGVKFDQLQVV